MTPSAEKPIHGTCGPRAWRALVFVGFVAVLALYLGRISGYPLQDPDEGRYAEIAREMVETGDWVTPHFNYVSYFHKPPLLYWATAISLRTFGVNEFAARLPVALVGLLTVFLTFALGHRMFGARAALFAAGILATSPLFFVLAQALVMDMLLTACLTAAFASVYALHVGGAKQGWAVSAALWVGLGFLTKGPISVLLVALVTVPFLIVRRDGSSFRALVGWRPIAVFTAVVLPWFVQVSLANPDFLEVFIVDHHLRRFGGEVGHKETGLLYFVPVILGGGAPWTVWAGLMALDKRLRAAFSGVSSDPRLFLVLWFASIFGLFSLSSTKLPTYMVPAFPALALLLGAWVDRALDVEDAIVRPLRRLAVLFGAVGATVLATAGVAVAASGWLAEQLRVDQADVRVMIGPVAGAGLALCLGGLFVSGRLRSFRVGAPALASVLVGAMAVALFSAIGGREVVKTSRDVALAIERERRPGDVVVASDHLLHGLPFYLEGRTVQAGDAGELQPGADRSDAHAPFFWKRDQLVEEWQSGRRLFVATDVRRLHELPADLSPEPRRIARDLKRVVLVNFEAPGDEIKPPD